MIDKKELKQKARSIDPVIRIGKSGLTENAVKEIKKQLKKKKLIKIKFLRNFISDKNKKQVANDVAEKTESILIDLIGFVVVLWKD
jgi:RNA-binding protein